MLYLVRLSATVPIPRSHYCIVNLMRVWQRTNDVPGSFSRVFRLLDISTQLRLWTFPTDLEADKAKKAHNTEPSELLAGRCGNSWNTSLGQKEDNLSNSSCVTTGVY